ncbi:MAG: chromosomal replication initiator protein DnaA, partial [Desulfobacterales bacterium]|nr:chromosomal replication initiator protein DnaA [Desulfobacterales bacterium]
MKAEQIWQAALGELQLQMTKATFDTWVRDTTVISYEDGSFIIGVHNGFAKDWLENRLLTTIKRTLTAIIGHAVEVKFTVWARNSANEDPGPILRPLSDVPASTATPQALSTMLNPRYTFENFIVGNSNRLAQAAALAVAEKPAEAYNPLFIYGGVGLGKTHLLHATGHVSLRKELRVLYVS